MDRHLPRHPQRAPRSRTGSRRQRARAGRDLRGADGAQPVGHRPDPQGDQIRGRARRRRHRAGHAAPARPAAAIDAVRGRGGRPRRHPRGPESGATARSSDRHLARAALPAAPRYRQRRALRQPGEGRLDAPRAAPAFHAPHQRRPGPLCRRRHHRGRPGLLHQRLRTCARRRARDAGPGGRRWRGARAAHRRPGQLGLAAPDRAAAQRPGAPRRGRRRQAALPVRAPPERLRPVCPGRPRCRRADGQRGPPRAHLAGSRRHRHRPAGDPGGAAVGVVVAGGPRAPPRTPRAGDLRRRLGSQRRRLLRVPLGARRRRLGGRPRNQDGQRPRRTDDRPDARAAARHAPVRADTALSPQRRVQCDGAGGARRRRRRSRVAGPVWHRPRALDALPRGAGRRRRVRDHQRHHRTQARRGAHRPHGAPRRTHRPAQPHPAAPAPERGDRPGRAERRMPGAGLRRSRRLQAGQRRAGAQCRRRAAQGGGPAHAGLPAPRRHPGPLRRRRIRPAADRDQPRSAIAGAGARQAAPGGAGAGAGGRPVGAGELQRRRGDVPARRPRRQPS